MQNHYFFPKIDLKAMYQLHSDMIVLVRNSRGMVPWINEAVSKREM